MRCCGNRNESQVRGRHEDSLRRFFTGQESGPWGRKISALAEVARSEGYETESVDYRGVDEPRERITRLARLLQGAAGDLVLVGSSLGGYVAVASASLLHARASF